MLLFDKYILNWYNGYMAIKTCTRCKQTKPVSDFYKPKYHADENGYDYYCKYCRNGAHLKSRLNNTKKCSLEGCDKTHYAKSYCRLHWANYNRHGHPFPVINVVKANKDTKAFKARTRVMKQKYHMTHDEYVARGIDGCEICGDQTDRNLHIDHDHKCCAPGKNTCGKCVRGVICNSCNQAVGKMENGLMRPDFHKYDLIKQYLEAYNVGSN